MIHLIIPPKIKHIINMLPQKITLKNTIPWMAIIKKGQLVVNEGSLSPGSVNYKTLPVSIPIHLQLPRKKEEVILLTPAALLDPTGGLDVSEPSNIRFLHTATVVNKGLMEATGEIAAVNRRAKKIVLALVGNAVDADMSVNLGGIYSEVKLIPGRHLKRDIKLINSGVIISGTLGINLGLIHGHGITITRPDTPLNPDAFKGVLKSVDANYGYIKDIQFINDMNLNVGRDAVGHTEPTTMPKNASVVNFGLMHQYLPYYSQAGKDATFYNFGTVETGLITNKPYIKEVPESLSKPYIIKGREILVNKSTDFDAAILASSVNKVVNKLSLKKDMSVNNAVVNKMTSSGDLGTLAFTNSVLNADYDFKGENLSFKNTLINAKLNSQGEVKNKLLIQNSVLNGPLASKAKEVDIKNSFINSNIKVDSDAGVLNLEGETYLNADMEVGNMEVNIAPSVRINSNIKDTGSNKAVINLAVGSKDAELSLDPRALTNLDKVNVINRVHYTARSMFDKAGLTKGATKHTQIAADGVLRVDINIFAKNKDGSINIPLNTAILTASKGGILYLSNPGTVFTQLFPNGKVPWLQAGDKLQAMYLDKSGKEAKTKLVDFSEDNLGIDDVTLTFEYDAKSQTIDVRNCPTLGCTVKLPASPSNPQASPNGDLPGAGNDNSSQNGSTGSEEAPKDDKPSLKDQLFYPRLDAVYKSMLKAHFLPSLTPTTKVSDKGEKAAIGGLLQILNGFYAKTPYAYSLKASKDVLRQFASQSTQTPASGEYSFDTKLLFARNDDKDLAKSYTYGGLLLLERGFEGFSTGLSLGTAHQKADFYNPSRLRTNSLFVGLYAKKPFGNLKLEAGSGYMYSQMDAKRKVKSNYQTLSAKARYHANAYVLYIQGQYDFLLGDFSITPLLRTSFNHIRQGSISESLSETPLEVRAKSANYWDVKLGTKLAHSLAFGSAKLTNSLGLYAVMTQEDEGLLANFKGGSYFDMARAYTPRNFASLAYELSFLSVGGVRSTLGLEYNFNGRDTSLRGRLSVGFRF